MFYKIYAINKKTEELKLFVSSRDFVVWIWGKPLDVYMVIISTPKGDVLLPWEKMSHSMANIDKFIEAIVN